MVLRVIMLVVWAAILGAFLGLLPSAYATWLTLLGAILLVAHLIEYFVFSKRISSKNDSTLKGFLMTIVFGVIYINGRPR